MHWNTLCAALFLAFTLSPFTFAQPKDSCTTLMDVKVRDVEINKATHIEAGSTEPIPWNQSRSAPLPAYCRVEGVIHRRTGVGGEQFGITFALAMPDKWNRDFLMQGGGGSNGIVLAPRASSTSKTVINGYLERGPSHCSRCGQVIL
jgi:hypothetical protein